MNGATKSGLLAINHALVSYKAAREHAKNYQSGSRARVARLTEGRLRDLLWQHRESIAELIREANP